MINVTISSRCSSSFISLCREGWLSNQSIPFARVEALMGEKQGCNQKKSSTHPGRCMGISGLVKTALHVLDDIKSSSAGGMTLVMQDYVMIQSGGLLQWLTQVPVDWDIIRFDCSGVPPSGFKFISPKVRHKMRYDCD